MRRQKPESRNRRMDGLWAEKMKASDREHLSQNFGGASKVYVSGETCQ